MKPISFNQYYPRIEGHFHIIVHPTKISQSTYKKPLIYDNQHFTT